MSARQDQVEFVVEGTPDAFVVFDEHGRCAHLNQRALDLASDLAGRRLRREDLLGSTVADVFPAFAGSDLEAQVRAAMHAGETLVLELPIGPRWFRARVRSAPPGTTAAVREVTAGRLAVAERRRRSQQQALITGLLRRAAVLGDLQDLLEEAVERVAILLGADLVLVARHDAADDRFRLCCAAGRAQEVAGRLLGPSASRSLLARALVRADAVDGEEHDAGADAIVALDAGGAGAVAVDVPGADRPFGALAVVTRRRRTFEPDELAVLRTVADVLATAADRARAERAPAGTPVAKPGRICRSPQDEVLAALDLPGGPEAQAAISRPPDGDVRAEVHELGLDADGPRPASEPATPPPEDDEAARERLRVLLVEGHTAIREAIAAALCAEPDVGDVRQAGSLAEARDELGEVHVAVIGLVLPDGSSADFVGDLRRHSPDAHALVIASDAAGAAAATAVERGAAGVLGRDACLQDVVAAIRRVHRGEPPMPPSDLVELLRQAGRRRERERADRQVLDSLTPREREVLQLLADGLDSHEAAARMWVSPRTHRNHMANILAKLGVHSQLQALLFALRCGAVELRRAEESA